MIDKDKIIAELKAENKELAHYLACMTEQRNKANTCLQEIKACNTCEHSTKIYGNENAELKALVSQRDASVTAQTGIILELKAENEKLREDYIKLSQQKDLDNARWQKRCTDLHIEDKAKADKYWLVLQEIKDIARANQFYFGAGTIVSYQTIKQIATNYDKILDLITKAEEE